MKKKFNNLRKMARGIFLILAFMFSIDAFAQQISVSGKVTDQTGAGLPGVTIVEKGTTNGTITDFDGIYSIKANKNTILSFSFVGMKNQEILVGDKTTINVVLSEETIGLDEVVAVGYGTQRKADLTGAIGIVKTDDMKEVPTGNVMKALQGHVAGVYIQTERYSPC
jgi:hypothetical protein